MRPVLVLAALFFASPAFAHPTHPPSPAITGNGLSTQVLFVGADRGQSSLTVSARITNTADTPAYLAIVGPAPLALDNKGGVHYVREIVGIAKCQTLDNSRIDDCIANQNDILPATTFTLLPPKVPTLLNIQLKARDLQLDTMVSFVMNAALARGQRPSNRRASEQKLENINIHMPLLPVN